MRPRDALLALLVMILWALNFPITKLGFAEFPPLLYMAVRFAMAAVLLCPFRKLPRHQIVPVALVSVTLGTFHFGPMFVGLSRIDAATAALLTQSQVPFAALLGAIFFKDRLSLRTALGMAVALLGVGLVIGEPRLDGGAGPVALILWASFAWAFANIQFKKIGALDVFALSGWMALFACPQLIALSLVFEEGQWATLREAGLQGWGAVSYGAVVVTILSYGLWYPLMRKYPISQVMPYTLLIPLLTVGLSYLILGERLGLLALLGGAATILGVAIIVLRPAPARPV